MPKLPSSYTIPFKESSINAAGKQDNEEFVRYMKQLVKSIRDMYSEISNVVNQKADAP